MKKSLSLFQILLPLVVLSSFQVQAEEQSLPEKLKSVTTKGLNALSNLSYVQALLCPTVMLYNLVSNKPNQLLESYETASVYTMKPIMNPLMSIPKTSTIFKFYPLLILASPVIYYAACGLLFSYAAKKIKPQEKSTESDGN